MDSGDATIEELGARILRTLADALDGEVRKNGAPAEDHTKMAVDYGKAWEASVRQLERTTVERDEARRERDEARRERDEARRERDEARRLLAVSRTRAHDAESALAAERGRPSIERTARLRAQRDRDDLLAAARELVQSKDGSNRYYVAGTKLADVVARVEKGL